MKQIESFGAEKDASGHPKHALMRAIIPEMTAAAQMLRQAGHEPDLPTVYEAAKRYATQTRPDIAQAALADARGQLQAFKFKNPVVADGQLERRMTSLAKADQRITGKVDLQSLMDRALKMEPEVAARQAAHAEREKVLGFETPRPSLRQLLESGYCGTERIGDGSWRIPLSR